MSRIEILPDSLVSQIAAGEVVERPASVVKELLENALDAGAENLEIDLEVGGKRRILVRDDGEGMERDDALRAFDRHATSKITSFEDLESVSTLGFRGEALASIAAVARVDMTTAAAPGEGFRVRIEGSAIRQAEPVAAPRGTSIDIRSLFYNVPARRRFLKTPRTELQRSMEVVHAYAMARPETGLLLRHEGRLLLEAPPGPEGQEGLGRRLESLYGSEFLSRLAAVPPQPLGDLAVWGFVGGTATARSRRRFTFVNRRLIRDRAVMATFYRAVRDEWRSEEFPALFLFLDLPGSQLDINVHPQKSEVRFRDRAVFDQLYQALRNALAAARAEEPVRPAVLDSRPSAPLAWQGSTAGPGSSSADRWTFAGEVAEPPRQSPAGDRLPQASLEPAPPRPVPLSGRSGEVRPFRLLGQYKGTVVLLEGPDGLYLIDQHVAHERILYERIRRNLETDEPQSQALIEPHLLEMSRSELLKLEPLLDELEGYGLAATPLSETSLAVSAVPVDMSVAQAVGALESLAQGPAEGPSAADLRRRLIEDAAASLSCRAAVKMHDPLGGEEMEQLVSELFACEHPFTCPHGRPVVLKFSDAFLETSYKRR